MKRTGAASVAGLAAIKMSESLVEADPPNAGSNTEWRLKTVETKYFVAYTEGAKDDKSIVYCSPKLTDPAGNEIANIPENTGLPPSPPAANPPDVTVKKYVIKVITGSSVTRTRTYETRHYRAGPPERWEVTHTVYYEYGGGTGDDERGFRVEANAEGTAPK